MKEGKQIDPIKIIERSTEELHQRIEMQRHLLLALFGRQQKGHGSSDLCTLLNCPHRRRLKEAIREAIEVLEETKKSFKSKTLEGLRKRLMKVLLEEEEV